MLEPTTIRRCSQQIISLFLMSQGMMRSIERYLAIPIASLVCFALVVDLPAQEAKPKSPRPVAASNAKQSSREISVTETFEPTFSIEPLSHRLTGRENEVIPFAFKIEARNKDADLEIAPIGLRQELSGQILYDEASGQTEIIQLLTPNKFIAKANVATTIEGVVKIPKGTAKFYSVGIMVKMSGEGRSSCRKQIRTVRPSPKPAYDSSLNTCFVSISSRKAPAVTTGIVLPSKASK